MATFFAVNEPLSHRYGPGALWAAVGVRVRHRQHDTSPSPVPRGKGGLEHEFEACQCDAKRAFGDTACVQGSRRGPDCVNGGENEPGVALWFYARPRARVHARTIAADGTAAGPTRVAQMRTGNGGAGAAIILRAGDRLLDALSTAAFVGVASSSNRTAPAAATHFPGRAVAAGSIGAWNGAERATAAPARARLAAGARNPARAAVTVVAVRVNARAAT